MSNEMDQKAYIQLHIVEMLESHELNLQAWKEIGFLKNKEGIDHIVREAMADALKSNLKSLFQETSRT